jgi:hypothetical protein
MERFFRGFADLGDQILGPPKALPDWRRRAEPANGRFGRAAGFVSCAVGVGIRAVARAGRSEADIQATAYGPLSLAA